MKPLVRLYRVMELPYTQARMGIDTAIADAIDHVLATMNAFPAWLSVDRDRLDESCEAWIHVLIDPPAGEDAYGGPMFGFGPCRGVLTWPNSD